MYISVLFLVRITKLLFTEKKKKQNPQKTPPPKQKQKQKILRIGGRNTQKNFIKKIFMTKIITTV